MAYCGPAAHDLGSSVRTQRRPIPTSQTDVLGRYKKVPGIIITGQCVRCGTSVFVSRRLTLEELQADDEHGC